jgi:ketosteroid isomerase-like protein
LPILDGARTPIRAVYAAAMSAKENADLARRAWDAISRGDADALRGTMTADVVWRATARGTPWSGVHKGHESVVDFLARVGEVSDFFQAELLDVLASEERALWVFHATFRRDGRIAELDYLLMGRVRDGRFAELWTVPLDPETIERFWAKPGA